VEYHLSQVGYNKYVYLCKWMIPRAVRWLLLCCGGGGMAPSFVTVLLLLYLSTPGAPANQNGFVF
jgi:hypothetical protein